ncbi:hypothetical protein DIPPA_35387 [Diplonema papillatum]|nr:hypothetical protein DIPPA_35387 [Diplonema papillatum]
MPILCSAETYFCCQTTTRLQCPNGVTCARIHLDELADCDSSQLIGQIPECLVFKFRCRVDELHGEIGNRGVNVLCDALSKHVNMHRKTHREILPLVLMVASSMLFLPARTLSLNVRRCIQVILRFSLADVPPLPAKKSWQSRVVASVPFERTSNSSDETTGLKSTSVSSQDGDGVACVPSRGARKAVEPKRKRKNKKSIADTGLRAGAGLATDQ